MLWSYDSHSLKFGIFVSVASGISSTCVRVSVVGCQAVLKMQPYAAAQQQEKPKSWAEFTRRKWSPVVCKPLQILYIHWCQFV